MTDPLGAVSDKDDLIRSSEDVDIRPFTCISDLGDGRDTKQDESDQSKLVDFLSKPDEKTGEEGTREVAGKDAATGGGGDEQPLVSSVEDIITPPPESSLGGVDEDGNVKEDFEDINGGANDEIDDSTMDDGDKTLLVDI